MILLLLRPALVGAAIRDSAAGGVLELGLRGQEEVWAAASTPAPTPDPDPSGAKAALAARYQAAIDRRDKRQAGPPPVDPTTCLSPKNRFEAGATAREKALHCFQPDEFLGTEVFGVETAKCELKGPRQKLKQCMEDSASLGVRWLACKGIAKTIPEEEEEKVGPFKVKKKWAVEKFGHFLAAAFFNCPACDCFRKFFDSVKNVCKIGMHRRDWCDIVEDADTELKTSKLKKSVFDVCGTDVFCGSKLAVPEGVP